VSGLPSFTAASALSRAGAIRAYSPQARCSPTSCLLPWVLNPETCQCECRPTLCTPPTSFLNPMTCACECPPFTTPRVCPSPAVFSEVTCECACNDGLTFCNNPPYCVNTASDPQHCGKCRQQCMDGRICQNGTCICSPPLTECGGSRCSNLYTDHDNCGACRRVCPQGQDCCNGVCTLLGTDADCSRCTDSCTDGKTCCARRCTDLQTDRHHCGVCDNRCFGLRVCVQGFCVCHDQWPWDCSGI
jgi:hypothetical protein